MNTVYATTEAEARKLGFFYKQSGIQQRYSVIPDYSHSIHEWRFYPQSENLEPFPSLEQRMIWYNKYAPQLSVDAVRNCISQNLSLNEVTHLITVSCTGMSAPGLDLQIVELLDLNKSIHRTSVNFMGCYAAIHAIKLADAICNSSFKAQVLIVCTELCTLHFQHENTLDNITSSLLFGDGAAAVLVTSNNFHQHGLTIDSFYSEIIPRGKRDMAWELSSSGFRMTLSGYVPDLIEEDFREVVNRAMINEKDYTEISHWCIHPGGKRILEAIARSLDLDSRQFKPSFDVLHKYGNLSSATILFVLKQILDTEQKIPKLFGAAFGPGLTVETFTCHN